MFPSGAMFLCPDWKAKRIRPKMEPTVTAFRRIALPLLLSRSGISWGPTRSGIRIRTVPHATCGTVSAALALEATLERMIPTPDPEGPTDRGPWLRREDIMVQYRPDPDLKLLVMLDTSLSMSGPHRALAAVIGAVLAKQSPSGGLALVAFHSESKLLIRFGERVKPLDAAYRVLGSPLGGTTNISAALEDGLSVLAGSGNRSAHAVLITDGERTAGPDPCDEAKKFRRLHVVLVGRRNVVSSREMARLGRGLWHQVDSLEATPPTLLRLLQRLCRD